MQLEKMADDSTVERKKTAAVSLPAASSLYMRRKQDRLASRTLDRTQRWPTRSLPLLAEAAAPYFCCLYLASARNTSPAGCPWPEIFFNQFIFRFSQIHRPARTERCVSTLRRLIVSFSAFVTLCCVWSCFRLRERLVCCDGEERLASAQVHRLQGSGK